MHIITLVFAGLFQVKSRKNHPPLVNMVIIRQATLYSSVGVCFNFGLDYDSFGQLEFHGNGVEVVPRKTPFTGQLG